MTRKDLLALRALCAWRSPVVLLLALAAPFVAGTLTGVLAQPQRVDPGLYGGLRWRSIGPFRGGRVNGVSGVPGQPNTFYFGSVGGGVWKTANAGRTWLPIFDSQPIASIGAIGVAPSNPNIVYVGTGEADMRSQISYGIGTDDGLIHLTQDDGKTWSNVTPRELNAWSKVVMLEASHFDANAAYAAVDRHRLTDNEPYIYRTRDAGRTWQKITSGLPAGVYLQTVKEDPKRRGLLVAGTELGVFVSFSDGDQWQPLQLNLPPTSMRDLAFHDNDLIVATHGRGFWVLDDISALRQAPDAASADVHLFKPGDAIILPPGTDEGTPTQKDEPTAENPPTGAIVDYYLKGAAAGPVTIEILNAAGATVRRFSSADPRPAVDPNTLAVNAIWQRAQDPPSTAAGMHRFVWDLRPEAPAGGRGLDLGGGGGGGGRGGQPPVAAGGFSVRLTVNGRRYTQPLTVKPDPRDKT